MQRRHGNLRKLLTNLVIRLIYFLSTKSGDVDSNIKNFNALEVGVNKEQVDSIRQTHVREQK
eukprot:Pgem_evm1s11206